MKKSRLEQRRQKLMSLSERATAVLNNSNAGAETIRKVSRAKKNVEAMLAHLNAQIQTTKVDNTDEP